MSKDPALGLAVKHILVHQYLSTPIFKHYDNNNNKSTQKETKIEPKIVRGGQNGKHLK
jgi:hypothetical protein